MQFEDCAHQSSLIRTAAITGGGERGGGSSGRVCKIINCEQKVANLHPIDSRREDQGCE